MDIELNFYWPPSLTWEEKTAANVTKYLSEHPEAETVDKLVYVFKQLGKKDFCILEFGDNKWDYLQFTYYGKYFILDFPYSCGLGRRARYRDTIELMLQSRGYRRGYRWYLGQESDNSRYYSDDLAEGKYPDMTISFGDHGLKEAAEISIEIVTNIFHLSSADDVGVRFGR